MKLTHFFTKENQSVWLMALFYLLLLLTGKISATEMVILYAMETVIIGAFHVLKMFVLTFKKGNSKEEKGMGVFFTFFFIIHYGFFVFLQTSFFFLFLSFADDRITDSFGLQNINTILGLEGIKIGLVFLIITNFLKFWFNFYKSDYYKGLRVELYMFQPYIRIIIQQIVAILPGFFIIFGKSGIAVAIVLIVVRTIIDVAMDKAKNNEHFFNKVLHKFIINLDEEDVEKKEQAVSFLKMIIKE